MQRFFVHFPLTDRLDILDDELVHQIGRVLRSRIGDHIVLFVGDGTESEYEIQSLSKKSIEIQRIRTATPDTSGVKKVTLMQALPNKYEKIEYILQKGVEIGIESFVFFRSERSQGLSISPSKQERFISIAREATEQCGGFFLPNISFCDEGVELLIRANHVNIMLDTQGDPLLGEYIRSTGEIYLWVGPEGGWSDDERKKMIDNGFISAHLGNRVFRTETAGIVMGSLVLYSL